MRRPPKPRITKAHLKWVWRHGRGIWQPLHRVTWTENGKRRERAIALDWKEDPQELDRLYWACEAGRHAAQQSAARYTWCECVIAWRRDPRVQKRLSDSTKRAYRREMDRLLELNAAKDMRGTTRQGVRRMHSALAATPRAADWKLQTVSLLWGYAKRELDWPLGDNPAAGIAKFGPRREYAPWPGWMIRKLADAPANVQHAAALILGTGQRPSAAIGMRWEQFRGEWMTVIDEKGSKAFEVFCPQGLRDTLACLKRHGAHVLAKNLAEPLGYDAIEKAFRSWRAELGERAAQFTLHGLRKLAIIELAEAGASDAEIQAVTGQSAEMVAFYRAQANRKRLSRAAQERRK